MLIEFAGSNDNPKSLDSDVHRSRWVKKLVLQTRSASGYKCIKRIIQNTLHKLYSGDCTAKPSLPRKRPRYGLQLSPPALFPGA